MLYVISCTLYIIRYTFHVVTCSTEQIPCVAVDETNGFIYWFEKKNKAIFRSKLDGTAMASISVSSEYTIIVLQSLRAVDLSENGNPAVCLALRASWELNQ